MAARPIWRREMLWTPWHHRGAEHLRLTGDREGILADGWVIGWTDRGPYRLHYRVRCDLGWAVREVWIALDGEPRLHLAADGPGNWREFAGDPREDLAGCIDVDISATPFTNSLPIRRLNLAEGESQELQVVYIEVPECTLRPVPQRYTCLRRTPEGGVYRYEALLSGFAAELQVDPDGFVLDYPGAFRRVDAGASR
nr:MAG: hypothetical protein DIU70_14485 [Bacillota bacterium]